MIIKNVQTGDSVQTKMLEGVKILAAAVKTTLGPRGRCVVLQRDNKFIMTKDGVSVAKEIWLEDGMANAAAQMVKEASALVNREAGDGTTTVTVLTEAILEHGLRAISAGANPTVIQRAVADTAKAADKLLDNYARPCTTEEDFINVATISANGQRDLAKVIGTAIHKVGYDGLVNIEEDPHATEDTHVFVEGYSFERGMTKAEYSNVPGRRMWRAENCSVLIVNETFTKDHFNAIKEMDLDTPLLIVADDYAEDVSNELARAATHNRSAIAGKLCCTKSPGYGTSRQALLTDLAFMAGGATIVGRDIDLAGLKVSDLGVAADVVVDRRSAVIIPEVGQQEQLEQYIVGLRDGFQDADSRYENNTLNERIAKLRGGVVTIVLSADSELEMKEKRDRVDDAVNAVAAAAQGGILPGGGTALLRIAVDLKNSAMGSDDYALGAKVLLTALEAPVRCITRNAGYEDAVVVDKIKSYSTNMGYDASSNTYVDMFGYGIIDPVKVTRAALQTAASIAGRMLTAGGMVIHADAGSSWSKD